MPQTIDNERINKKNMSTNNTTYLGKKMEDKSSEFVLYKQSHYLSKIF
jgi:hypothetical protein